MSRHGLLVSTALFALAVSAAADLPPLTIDVCRFRSSAGKLYVELYVDLPRRALAHRAAAGSWVGSAQFTAEINRDGETIARDTWRLEDDAATPEEAASGQHMVDTRSYEMMPGDYDFTVTAEDSLGKGRWTVNLPVKLRPYPEDQFTISDIQLGSYLIPAEANSISDRGGFALIPCPERLFGTLRRHFVYYAEFYPPAAGDSDRTYTVRRVIRDAAARERIALSELSYRGTGRGFTDVDSVSLEGLPMGSYSFELRVSTSDQKDVVQSARFFVLDTIGAAQQFTPGSVGLDSTEIEAELSQVRFLLVPEIRRNTLEMTLRDKADFLEAFWRRHDDDPATPDVPARHLFQERITTADEIFHTDRLDGHLTDRGRIYCLYGEPNGRDRHPHEIDAKPYEVWRYDRIEGGVTFAFVDRSGFDDYTLVHSDKSGEFSNPDWYDQYVARSDGTGVR